MESQIFRRPRFPNQLLARENKFALLPGVPSRFPGEQAPTGGGAPFHVSPCPQDEGSRDESRGEEKGSGAGGVVSGASWNTHSLTTNSTT